MITQMIGAIDIPSCLDLATIPTVPPFPFSWSGRLDINPSLGILIAFLPDLNTNLCPFFALESAHFTS